MQKIIHSVHIKASPQKVFDTIATEKGLSNWWTTRVKAKEEVGGIIEFTFLTDFNPQMKITAFRKPVEVKWECVAGASQWQDNHFSFELEKTDDGTLLKFTQIYANEISEKDYGTYNFNWAYYLQSLKEYCETGKGKPYVVS